MVTYERLNADGVSLYPKNRSIDNSTLVFGVFFIVCALLSQIMRGMAIVTAIVLIVYFINLFITDSKFVWKYAYIFFSSISYLIGELVCDLIPTYLTELNVYTHYTGAFSMLALYYWCFYTILRVADYHISRRIKHDNVVVLMGNMNVSKLIFKIGSILVFLFGTILFLPIANRPAFMLNLSRFGYSSVYLPKIISRLVYYPTFFSPLIVWPIIKKEKGTIKKKIVTMILAYIPYILFLIWAGHKFGSFWTLAYSLAIPLAFAYGKQKISFKTILIIVIIIVLLLFSTVFFYVSRGNTFEYVTYMLTWRTSAQGELWWAMFDSHKNSPVNIKAFFDELHAIYRSIITNGAERNYGVYHLMNMFGSASVLKRAYEDHWRYSAGGFELPFYFFKYGFFIIVPLFQAPLYSYIINHYLDSIFGGAFISAICYLQVLHNFHTAALQGDWLNFFTVDSIVFIMIIIIARILKKYAGYARQSS